MPDGTLIQGKEVSNVSSGVTITFPQVFQGNVFTIQLTPRYNTRTTTQCIFSLSNITNSQFSVYAFDTITNDFSTANNLSFHWLAFGRWKE